MVVSRGLVLRAESAGRQCRQGKGLRRRSLSPRPGARYGRTRSDDDICPARHRRCSAFLGERGAPRAQGAGGKRAQEIEAANFYRPRDSEVLAAHAADFPKLTLYDFAEVFGDWQKAQATYFADKGVFDQIYKPAQ